MKDVCTQTIWDHTEEELGMTYDDCLLLFGLAHI